MALQTPTRITIEIHQPDSAGGPRDGATEPMSVRVVPENGSALAQSVVVGTPREDVPLPAAYDPGPCLCLDDEDCGADHGNE